MTIEKLEECKNVMSEIENLREELGVLNSILESETFDLSPNSNIPQNMPWFTLTLDNGEVRNVIERRISILSNNISTLEIKFANL